MRNMIHGTMTQKLWTTTKSRSTRPLLLETWTWLIQLSNILIPIFTKAMNTKIVWNQLFWHPTQDGNSCIPCYTKSFTSCYFVHFKAKVTTCKTIEYVLETLSKAIISTPIAIHKWFNKPRIQHTKKYCKTSKGSGKFSHNLRASKQPCYNKQNCKSGRHGCRHTFMKRKSMTTRAATNNSNQDLKIKGRKLGTFKSPPSPLHKDLIVYSKPSTVSLIAKILTVMNTILYHMTNLTCAKIIYPWNKIILIDFPSASSDIVSLDMFFWIPTHSMMWIHGRRLYDHQRNQGV